MRVVLGNRHAVHKPVTDGDLVKMPRGKRATTIEIPDECTLGQAFRAVTDERGVWALHATEGAIPAWVASDSSALASLLAEHFGGIEVRELEDDRPAGGGGITGAAGSVVGLMLALPMLLWLFAKVTPSLKTNAGNDFQAKQMAGSASATAVAKWMAITANTTAASATDTTLTAEITTAGGGLLRQAAVYAHTTAAASYTLTGTFTANGSDSLPVTIGKMGVFDAASTGNLVFETLVSPTATLSASGDSLVVTETVSL